LDDVFEPRELLINKGSGAATVPCLNYEKLPLEDATFINLVEAAETNVIIDQISLMEPELLRARRPSECHRLAKYQLELADNLGITQAGARKHFAAMALYLNDGFLTMPESQKFLGDLKVGVDYFSALNALSEEFWLRAN
jgi:hypothetical protein